MNTMTINAIAAIIAGASPVVLAVIGEVITERSGVTNLSLNGVILLSAMVSFAVALVSGSLLFGFFAGAMTGAFSGAIVAISSIYFRQSQVAVGFVLAMLLRDLSYFLGTPFMSQPGPVVQKCPILILKDIPILGNILFEQNPLVYLSFATIFFSWVFIYKTRWGLVLRGIGENAMAVHNRGKNVNRLRILYSSVGGFLVGIAGAGYSLFVKPGWNGTLSGLDGIGWIVLSITIFGGWNPVRGALGAYLFIFLQWLGLTLQAHLPNIPSQVLQVAPFPLMILTLLLINVGKAEWVEIFLSRMPLPMKEGIQKLLEFLGSPPPADLGKVFKQE